MKCPKCQMRNPEKFNRCFVCDTPLTEPTPRKLPARYRPIVEGCLIAASVILGVLYLF